MLFKPTEKIELDFRSEFTTLEELNAIRVKLAKRANSRLLRLEKKAQKESDGKSYIGWAYKPATRYTQEAYGKSRFNTNKNFYDDPFQVMEELDEIIMFLNSESSTITGINNIENRIINTFDQKHGLKIENPKDFFNFLETETYKNALYNISSGQIQEFFNRVQQTGKDKTREFAEKLLDDFNNSKDQTIEQLYEYAGLDFFEYIGKK